MQELRAAFDAADSSLMLTAAVSAHHHIISQAYDVPALNRYLDFVNLMTFDFHGGWETETGLIAPLYGKDPSDKSSVVSIVQVAARVPEGRWWWQHRRSIAGVFGRLSTAVGDVQCSEKGKLCQYVFFRYVHDGRCDSNHASSANLLVFMRASFYN